MRRWRYADQPFMTTGVVIFFRSLREKERERRRARSKGDERWRGREKREGSRYFKFSHYTSRCE